MEWKYFEPEFEFIARSNDKTRAWVGHINFAYDLVSNFKPGIIVELGTHNGTSLFSMCQSIKDNKLPTKIFAVDTWKGDSHANYYDETVYKGVNDIKNSLYGGISLTLIRKTFDEALSEFQDESIDILHIDGFHTYEAVKHDYDTWARKVKKNGIILFHDVNEMREGFGVYRLWDELKNNFCTIEFKHSHGLGVLFMNASDCGNLQPLESEWNTRYSELGRDVDLKFLLADKESAVREKELVISDLEHKIMSMESSKFWKMRSMYLKLKHMFVK